MIFIGDDFKVVLKVNEALSTAQLVEMCYIKPDSTTVYTVTPTDVNVTTDEVTLVVSRGINIVPGNWLFYAKVRNSDGLIGTTTELRLKTTAHISV